MSDYQPAWREYRRRRKRTDAPECAFVAQRHGNPLDSTTVPDSVWDHDARIKAVALASPAVLVMFRSGGVRNVHVPVLIWRGTADPNAPDAWNAAVVRSGLPTPPEEHVVPNAGHFVFSPVCSAAVLREFEPSVVAFFDAHLT